jgi:ABC-2 type transport system permease protein
MYFLNTTEPSTYMEALTNIYGLALAMTAAVFGGWLVGHEYRQGTLRRMASIDARRGRLIATKAFVGTAFFLGAAALIGVVGAAATELAANLGGVDLLWDGVARSMAGSMATAMVYGAFSLALSLVFRNDSYAMLTTIGVLVVFSPLLSLIPTVGDYLPGTAIDQLDTWVRNVEAFGQATISNSTALVVLTAWLGGVIALGMQLFARRDI